MRKARSASEGESRNNTTNTLQQYTTEGGCQVAGSWAHLLVDPHPEGDTRCTTLLPDSHPHYLQSHEEVRGNERTTLSVRAAVVPGIHELQRSIQSTAMNTLWIPWNKQNLRYACMAHGAHQSNHSPWYSAPCTHAVPLVTPHCMITSHLSIQSWMGALQHKGKVTFSKTWRGNVISLFKTGQTCLLTNTYVLTAHCKSTMNISMRANDIHCILWWLGSFPIGLHL